MAKRTLGGVLLVGMVVSIAAVSAVPLPGHASDRAAVPRLDWSTCHAVYQCATTEVPLDYDDPSGRTIQLALIRRPAADPERRIGSLFVNPGGPGAAITDPVIFAGIGSALGDQVAARFDVVGIDPRGAGGSTPVTCPEAPDIDPVAEPTDSYPTEGQYAARFAYDDYLRDTCAATAGEILDHMSTADNARDMDLIRQAVGDEQLSYYGLSYGSLLGQTYAAMFPDRVRAIAVDAVLDPVTWTTGELPPFARIESGKGASEMLTTALSRCDQVSVVQCPLSGNAEARWQRIRKSLAQQPMSIGEYTLDGKTFVEYTESAFQLDRMAGVPAPTIRLWMGAVRLVETVRPHTTASKPARSELEALLERLHEATDLTTGTPGTNDVTAGAAVQHGTWCADTENPTRRQVWIDAGKAADVAGLGVGPAHVWNTSVCANWPGSNADAYRGPFDVTTATPLLMIGLTYDTVTPIAGVRAAAARFPGSRVIEVQTWGHTALGKSNGCLRPATEAYLLGQRLPAKDQLCEPDQDLYGNAADRTSRDVTTSRGEPGS